MHRIDTATAQKDKFGVGKNGFTSGNPQTGVPATEVSADILDAFQEEACAVIAMAGMQLNKSDNSQLASAIQAIAFGAYPVGAPIPWPLATPPAGFLVMAGQAFSAALYPRLAAAYPSAVLPDLRGEFIRGWDNGRGVDPGRTIGSLQLDAMQRMMGTFGNCQLYPAVNADGVFTQNGNVSQTLGLTLAPANTGAGVTNFSFDNARVVRTASETRPRNAAFNYIVRAA